MMKKSLIVAFTFLSFVLVSCGGEDLGKGNTFSPLIPIPIPGTTPPSKPPPTVPKPPVTPPAPIQPPAQPPVQPPAQPPVQPPVQPPAPVIPPFTADPLKIHSYKLVHKFSTVTNEKRLFHQLEVDKGAEAIYEVLYKNTILDPLVAYNRIVCTGTPARCEVQSLQNNETYELASLSNVLVTEDSLSNRRKIEILDPTFKDYKDGDFIGIQATADGKKSPESLAKVVRQ